MLKRKSIIAGFIAASIIMPATNNEIFANQKENAQVASIDTRTITGNAVNFRKGPSTSHSSIGKFYKGDKVEFIAKEGDWTKVRANGKEGYVFGKYVSEKEGSSSDSSSDKVVGQKIVTGNGVNFRKGPSTSYSSIGKLNKGTTVDFISESNGWSKIKYNGTVGYMSSQYLSDKNTTQPSTPDSSNDKVVGQRIVTGNSVNFRKGPSTSYSSITKLNYGTVVDFISESNGWSKIKHNGTVGYMSSQYLVDKNTSELPSSQKADKVITEAKKHLGKDYVWGAEGPNTFDCSGFTQYVFKKSAGVSIPRVSRDQAKFGQLVSRNNLQKGDLIFFDTDGSTNNGYVSHVGIYMGNGEFIHASSSADEVVISKFSGYYSERFVNARRVL